MLLANKKSFSVLFALVLILVAFFLPCPDGLSQEAKMAIALMFAGLILWITQVIPNGISALLIMAVMPYFGIFTFSELWSKFISSAFFFVMVSFSLSAALSKTSIPIRANAFILSLVGSDSKRIVLGFMIVSSVLSMLCANIATIAMMMSFTVGLLKANKSIPKKSQFGKCLVMGVAYGAMIGGCATLSGSSSHVMLLSITENTYGFSVSFLDWLKVSIPFVAVLLPVTWFWLTKVFKPEPVARNVVDDMIVNVREMGPMTRKEKAFCVFLVLVFTAWISSTWVPMLNLTAISLIALAVMFFPGVQFLDFDGFVKGVSWNLLLLMGGVVALTAGISETGGMAWFVNQAEPLFMNMNHTIIYLFVSTFLCIVHCIVPSGTATAGITALPMMEIARLTGANPTAIFHMVGWWAGTVFLMPVDSLLLLAFSFGYTDFRDPFKAGIVPTFALIVLSSTLTPFLIETFNIGMPLV